MDLPFPPMLLERAEAPFADAGWLYQVKWDGVRNLTLVEGGRVLAADEAAILRALQAAGERMWPRMKDADWAGRSADQLAPQTYPDWA